MRALLKKIDFDDRVKYCKADFESLMSEVLKSHSLHWNLIFPEFVAILEDFFICNYLKRIPRDVLVHIMLFLPVNNMANVVVLNKEWMNIGLSDELWRYYYHFKFPLFTEHKLLADKCKWNNHFRCRFEDPEVGDKVEVAWRGKFRLETQDVYQGLAWWRAEVVDKHRSQYKIHYPGWESRWDEWVPKTRLRWVSEMDPFVKIEVGDIVELWCCGTNVPGAWLESKVRKIKDGKYCLGKIISSGYLWIERDRIRFVRKSKVDPKDNRGNELHIWNMRKLGDFSSCIIT